MLLRTYLQYGLIKSLMSIKFGDFINCCGNPNTMNDLLDFRRFDRKKGKRGLEKTIF